MERLIKIGEIKPTNSKDIKDSSLGLGMEKLDRDAFDPQKGHVENAQGGVDHKDRKKDHRGGKAEKLKKSALHFSFSRRASLVFSTSLIHSSRDLSPDITLLIASKRLE